MYQKKNSQHLIGAIYYDGWSDCSTIINSNTQSLYEASGLPDIAYYNDWREYVNAKDGQYPPKDCSFSMYYPQYAPVGYQNQPSRKPFWGWRRDNVLDIEQEINLAADYGIDYFMFCFYPRNCFNDSNEVNDTALRNGIGNKALYNFLQASNRCRIKFCVMIENSNGISNTIQLKNLITYISNTFFTDPSYLSINGSPVIGLYKWNFNDSGLDDSYRVNNCKFISGVLLNDADGRFWYQGKWEKEPYGLSSYASLSDYNNRIISNVAKYANCHEILCIPVLAGVDDRARHDFSNGYNDETLRSFEKPTKQEFYQAMIEAIHSSVWAEGMDQTILIYAWNEFGEGGFLPPTYGDTTTQPNNYPVMENGVQKTDSLGNPLFFDFYKLEAILMAKQYWLNLANSNPLLSELVRS